MNQEKIGKFIQESRKRKKITQQELAEKLGVSDRTIGNWENGRNMPDLSLFKPICEELDITINEFLSGEKLKKEEYQEKFEENIINTIDYSVKKIKLSNKTIGIILFVLGIIITLSSLINYQTHNLLGNIYTIIGMILSTIGLIKLLKIKKIIFKVIASIIFIILSTFLILTIDYCNAITHKKIPRFCMEKTYNDNVIECKKILSNIYAVNVNTPNEYIIIDKEKDYNLNTIPNVPFNREKSGIDNIIKYKNKYVGNNSNDGNLINSLPLSEYGYLFEIDSKNLGLTIDYHITDWYINENYYLEKSIVYNSVSLFILIDNLEYIKFNFSGKTYEVKRKNVEEYYPNYKEILNEKISKESFNKYLEEKINDIEFIDLYFNKIIEK